MLFVDNFCLQNVSIDMSESSSSVIAHHERLQISNDHDRHVNLKTKHMKRQRDLVVIVKAFVVILLSYFEIHESVAAVFEMYIAH